MFCNYLSTEEEKVSCNLSLGEILFGLRVPDAKLIATCNVGSHRTSQRLDLAINQQSYSGSIVRTCAALSGGVCSVFSRQQGLSGSRRKKQSSSFTSRQLANPCKHKAKC